MERSRRRDVKIGSKLSGTSFGYPSDVSPPEEIGRGDRPERGLHPIVGKGVAREGEDDLRDFRWNFRQSALIRALEKFSKIFGEERKSFPCLHGSCRAEDD